MTVKCGKADIEATFVLSSIQNECKGFKKNLDVWGNDIKEWRAVRIAYFPRFSQSIVADIRENKAVIYEYDKVDFIRVYRAAVDISNLYKIAYDYRTKVANMDPYISSPEEDYLLAVDLVCRWAGSSTYVAEWLAHSDLGRQFSVTEEVGRLLASENALASIDDVVWKNLVGYWCETGASRYIAFHSRQGDISAFEYGELDGRLFVTTGASSRMLRKKSDTEFVMLKHDPYSRQGAYTKTILSLSGKELLLERGGNKNENTNDQSFQLFRYMKCAEGMH